MYVYIYIYIYIYNHTHTHQISPYRRVYALHERPEAARGHVLGYVPEGWLHVCVLVFMYVSVNVYVYVRTRVIIYSKMFLTCTCVCVCMLAAHMHGAIGARMSSHVHASPGTW